MTKSIKRVANAAQKQDAKIRKLQQDAAVERTLDSLQNFTAALGYGTDTLLSQGTYGFNPITRVRTLLEWIHRGSWLGGVAIDLVADDMTRAGIELKGDIEPTDVEEIQEAATYYGVWNQINDAIKWSRLYGGSLGLLLIDGQNLQTPFRIDTVGKDQFKGIMVLDRWMVEPTLQDLITEMGPNLGLPKAYRVTAQAPAFSGKTIHYSRVFRLEGIHLPYWQALMENLWGISIIERLYDRMISFDSATMGAAQLAYKSYLRTYKIKNFREIVGAGGPALAGLVKQVNFMRQTQTNEGITLLDDEDTFETHETSAFSGLSDVILQLGQQLAGALQIPLVRLFGQSPAGLNSTGESDLRTYYDGINQQQNRYLKDPVTKIYRCIAQSLGKAVPEGFSIDFSPLWQLTDEQKSNVAKSTTEAVLSAQGAGLVSDQVGLRELKQSSEITGVWSNISTEDIEAASDVPAPPVPEGAPGEGGEGGGASTEDRALHKRLKWHGFDVSIENAAGTYREGLDNDGTPFRVKMRHDYGYLRRTEGADGEQLDVFVGKHPDAKHVHVIHTMKAPDFKEYDEDKCFLDFESPHHAMQAFFANYGDRPQHYGSIESMDVEQFIEKALKAKAIPVTA